MFSVTFIVLGGWSLTHVQFMFFFNRSHMNIKREHEQTDCQH